MSVIASFTMTFYKQFNPFQSPFPSSISQIDVHTCETVVGSIECDEYDSPSFSPCLFRFPQVQAPNWPTTPQNYYCTGLGLRHAVAPLEQTAQPPSQLSWRRYRCQAGGLLMYMHSQASRYTSVMQPPSNLTPSLVTA